MSTFFVLLVLSIISGLTGSLIYGDFGTKPLVYTILTGVGMLIKGTGRINPVKLAKLLFSLILLEVIVVLVMGGVGGVFGEIYLFRKFPVISVWIPRVYSLWVDSHITWTIMAWFIVSMEEARLIKQRPFYMCLILMASLNVQVLLQYIGTLSGRFKDAIVVRLTDRGLANVYVQRGMVISTMSALLVLYGLLFSSNHLSLEGPSAALAINKLILDSRIYALQDLNLECVVGGCAVNIANDEFNNPELFGLNFLSDIGVLKLFWEYGIVYTIVSMLYFKKRYGNRGFLFYAFGILHYPLVYGIPFAIYIPLIFEISQSFYEKKSYIHKH